MLLRLVAVYAFLVVAAVALVPPSTPALGMVVGNNFHGKFSFVYVASKDTTQPGNVSWTRQQPTHFVNRTTVSIAYSDATKHFFVPTFNGGPLLKSQEGTTWSDVTLPAPSSNGGCGSLYWVSFAPHGGAGVLMCDKAHPQTPYITSDGGTSWRAVSPQHITASFLTDSVWVNSSTVVLLTAFGSYTISTDGGESYGATLTVPFNTTEYTSSAVRCGAPSRSPTNPTDADALLVYWLTQGQPIENYGELDALSGLTTVNDALGAVSSSLVSGPVDSAFGSVIVGFPQFASFGANGGFSTDGGATFSPLTLPNVGQLQGGSVDVAGNVWLSTAFSGVFVAESMCVGTGKSVKCDSNPTWTVSSLPNLEDGDELSSRIAWRE